MEVLDNILVVGTAAEAAVVVDPTPTATANDLPRGYLDLEIDTVVVVDEIAPVLLDSDTCALVLVVGRGMLPARNHHDAAEI